MKSAETLVVGDLMRLSVQLVVQFKADPFEQSVLTRVKSIERQTDGTVVLWLENASDESSMTMPRAMKAES